MNEIIELLNKRIELLNNEISEYNKVKKVEELAKMFDEDRLIDLTFEEVENFEHKAYEVMPLDYKVTNILEQIACFDMDLRKLKYATYGLSDEEKYAINAIKNSINITLNSFNINSIAEKELAIIKYKDLIEILSGKREVENLDTIYSFIDESDLSIASKLEVLCFINEKIIKNYVEPEEELDNNEVLDESSLEVKNMESSDLELLFKKYNISWYKSIDETNNLTRKIVKEDRLSTFIDKLVKFGSYDKYDEILAYLQEKKLTKIFEMPEVLTKILLFSSVDRIDDVYRSLKEGGLNDSKCVSLFLENPTFLYPAIKEKSVNKKKNSKTSNGGGERTKSSVTYENSGSLNYIVSNLEFLKSIGISSSDVYSNCVTLLSNPTDSLKKRYKVYKEIYGIDINEKNLSALKYNLVEWLDIMVESNAINYAREYPTTLYERNPYAIKYLYSKGLKYGDLFSNTGKMRVKNNPELTGSIYDSGTTKIFEEYGASEFVLDEKEKFEEVVGKVDEFATKFDCQISSEKISELDKKYELDSLTYKFGDKILISRIKVLRIYDALVKQFGESEEALKYAITYNSLLNDEELTIIRKCLSGEYEYERQFGSVEDFIKCFKKV